VGAVAHFLEEAGIATTSISLVRENTEGMRPPRALWVPFDLGRPFGAPRAAALQTEVLRAALALLERQDGPVILEDFPHDAPRHDEPESMEGMVCPVHLRKPPKGEEPQIMSRIAAEIAQLAPWHEIFVAAHGRSTATVSGLSVNEAARVLNEILATGTTSSVGSGAEELGRCLRFASEDLRNWYLEAASSRPGGAAAAKALADWFWGETAAGELILTLHPVCLASADTGLRGVAESQLVPRAQQHRLRN